MQQRHLNTNNSPIVAIIGTTNTGKSTLGNALLLVLNIGIAWLWDLTIGIAWLRDLIFKSEGLDLIFKSEGLECTACLFEPVVDASRIGIFTVYDAAGNRNYPIEKLVHYKVRETDQKIVLYCERSDFLHQARLIDTPGFDSTVEYSHNRKATEFLATPENYDVLVHVRNPHDPAVRLQANALMPTPYIVVINRIDEEIKWHDDASTPEGVIQEQVELTRTALIEGMTRTELLPTVLGCSAIVGVASFRWADEILEHILDLAKTGNRQLLTVKTFFDTHERVALAKQASAALRSPYDQPSYQPSFAAIRFALGAAMRESIRTPATLRERMRSGSGVDTLREAVLSAAGSPLVAIRREHLADVRRYQTQADATQKDLQQTRSLLLNAKRLTEKHTAGGYGATEDLKFLDEVQSHLSRQVFRLANQAHEHRQHAESERKAYITLANELACARLVKKLSDDFSETEKRYLSRLFASDTPIAEVPAWLEQTRQDPEASVVRRFVSEHAFAKKI